MKKKIVLALDKTVGMTKINSNRPYEIPAHQMNIKVKNKTQIQWNIPSRT